MPSSIPDPDGSENQRARRAAQISAARYSLQPEPRVALPVVLGLLLLLIGVALFALLRSHAL